MKVSPRVSGSAPELGSMTKLIVCKPFIYALSLCDTWRRCTTLPHYNRSESSSQHCLITPNNTVAD